MAGISTAALLAQNRPLFNILKPHLGSTMKLLRKLFVPFSTLIWVGLALGTAAPVIAQAEPIDTPRETARTSATRTAYSTTASPVKTESEIVLNLAQRRVFLYRNDMLVSSYPVAVGTAETPTPQGEFTVSQMVTNPVWQSPWTGEVHEPGADSALGLRWIEFATSDEGAFGFHGTPTIESIGQAASNGCVRMRNEDVVELFAQVDVGTRVVVQ